MWRRPAPWPPGAALGGRWERSTPPRDRGGAFPPATTWDVVELVASVAISIDGYGAGPGQDLEHPLGVGLALHDWLFHTRSWRPATAQARGNGDTGVDDDIVARSWVDVGAWIMGRTMFGPIRGLWPDQAWKGWWGDEPPYHVPVFVLTHHARPPLRMRGGAEFRFVTDGSLAALEQAREVAGELSIRLGGGVATVRQYLRAGLIDEHHLATAPVLLGRGEHLLEGIDARALGYRCTERRSGGQAVSHVALRAGQATQLGAGSRRDRRTSHQA